ncbi:MAG: hypothetical protein ACI4I6_06695 [Hominimerdicola sp.]
MTLSEKQENDIVIGCYSLLKKYNFDADKTKCAIIIEIDKSSIENKLTIYNLCSHVIDIILVMMSELPPLGNVKNEN